MINKQSKIYCIGNHEDKVFSYTVEKLSERGRVQVLPMTEICIKGTVAWVSKTNQLYIQVASNTHILDGDSYVYARPKDLSEHYHKDQVREARFIYSTVCRFLRVAKFKRSIGCSFIDITNYSKIAHLMNFQSLCAAYDVAIPGSICSNNFAKLNFDNTNRIVKGVSSRKSKVIDLDQFEKFRSESSIPILIQEKILGPEIRVHVVQDSIHSQGIVSENTDYRFDKSGNEYFSMELPENISKLCIKIRELCGCVFVGIDFKIDCRSGKYYFLEVNNMPDYIGYDKRLNFSISNAIYEYFD